MKQMLLGMIVPCDGKLRALLQEWSESSRTFVWHDVPKIVAVIIVSVILVRLLRLVTGKIKARQTRKLPADMSVRQVQTSPTSL